MIQTNLTQLDALYDQRRLAREVREFGANVLLYNIGGIFAFYPTRLALHAVNPHMKGDALGAALEAARGEGLRLVGRYDMSKATRLAYEAHPDWFVHNAKGEPLEYNGTYQACVNGGWYQDYAREIISESLGAYDVDGVFFNMFGYRNFDYSGRYFGVCACENCRRRFRDMYGKALPAKEDFSDSAFEDYLDFKDRTSRELQNGIYDHIKKVRPSVAMTGRYEKNDLIRMEVQRAVDRPQPEWPYQAGEQARWGRAYGLGKTVSSTSANFVDFAWRYHAETGAYHRLRFAQQLGSGATLDYYLLGTMDQPDKRPMEDVRGLFQWHAGIEDAYRGLRPGANIALYHSQPTERFRARTRSGGIAQAAFRGAYRALAEDRLPFDFVVDVHVGTVEGYLDRYDAIVMANVTCLSEREAQALDAFVERGGLLVITGETACYTERGQRRDRPALASMHCAAMPFQRTEMKGAYLKVGEGELPLPGVGLIMLDGSCYTVAPEAGDETGLTLLPPQRFGPPELCFPDWGSDQPGRIARAHGKGKVEWLPWHPDWLYHDHSLPSHRTVLTDPIRRHLSPPAVIEGRGAVELTVQHQDATGRMLVHVINYAGQRNNLYEDAPALHGLRLGVQNRTGTARALVAGAPVAPEGARGADGYTWYRLPPVAGFEVIQFEGE